MPRRYEAIRDSFKSQGVPEAAAKTRAAKVYNATRKPHEAPVTGKAEAGKKRKRRLVGG